MAGYVCLGALAAFGVLCGLWALFGWLLPGDIRGAMVCLCSGQQEEWLIFRYRCLLGLGLIRGPLLLVGSKLSQEEQAMICRRHRNIEFCPLEALPARLELERSQLG